MNAESADSAAGGPDLAFVELAKETLDELLESAPEMATTLGDHRFDDRLADESRVRWTPSAAAWPVGWPSSTAWTSPG